MSKNDISKMKYEESLNELEQVLARLEGNQTTLEEMLQLFDRGRLLAGHCQNLLTQAELKVEMLNQPKKEAEKIL